MELSMNPSAWVGLLTLVILEIALGIDNLIFIVILADKLLPKQRDKACLLGLSLVLTIRLGLLSLTLWMVTLTKPLFAVMDFPSSGHDLIMLFGGILLLFKATAELHKRLESRDHDPGYGRGYVSFWVVATQIVILDTVFSLDAVIIVVGMVNHLPVTMAAVVITMATVLPVSKSLTQSVNQYLTVVVLCLSSLLAIGLNPMAKGFGFHIPKGYLYTTTSFSIVIEVFNQITCRNFIHHQSTLPLQAHTADAILRLMGGKRQTNIQHNAGNPMPMLIPEDTFAGGERYIINDALALASRSLRGIMMPRSEVSWVDANLGVDEIHEQLLFSSHSLLPVCHGKLDEIIGIVRVKELLVALEEGIDVAAIASASPVIIVPETLDPISLPGVLCRACGSFVTMTNEFGVIQSLVAPLGTPEAIVGEFLDTDETSEIITDGDSWPIKGGTDLCALQQTLDIEHLTDDDGITTVVGLVASTNGHVPHAGDVIDVGSLHVTIIEANDYRVDLVRIVKEQPAHNEDE